MNYTIQTEHIVQYLNLWFKFDKCDAMPEGYFLVL